MPQIYVLFEHAAGFAVFRTTEFEEIAVFLPQVKKSILDISRFRSVVYFVAFQAFKNQQDADESMKSIASGELSKDLQLFLENNIPRTKKSKQAVVLGVQDPGLASVICDKLSIKCITSDIVREICRGIRFHFHKLIKGFKDINSLDNAVRSLGHRYSREKGNFTSMQHDSMIIQSLNVIDQLEKDIRTFTIRVRGWYAYHFPELFSIMGDNIELYIKCVDAIGDRKNLPGDIEERLNALVGNTSKVQDILEAVHNSMGVDISSTDLENMRMFCQRVLSLIKQRRSTIDYLTLKMRKAAPNVSMLVGEMIGSRLISRAGGLLSLAKLPASTVQVLGADKKFFRTLTGNDNPTWGVLAGTSFMGKVGTARKGRLSRFIANKCTLASRVDCFSKAPTDTYGNSVFQQVETLVKSFKSASEKVKKVRSRETSNTVDKNVSKTKKVKKTKSDFEMNKTFVPSNSEKLDIKKNSDKSLVEVNGNSSHSEEDQNAANHSVSEDNSNNNSNDDATESHSEHLEPVAKASRKRKSGANKPSAISDKKKNVSKIAGRGCKKPLKKRKLKK